MTFLEKQFKGDKYYYYLTKTIRLEDNKYKKIRHFVEASEKELTKAEEEVLKLFHIDEFESILEEHLPVTKRTDFDCDVFFEDEWPIYSDEDLKDINIIQKKYKKLKKTDNQDYLDKIEQQFIIRHSYDTNKVEGSSFTLEETEALLTKGLVTEPHLQREIFEITNIRDGFEYIMEYKGELSNNFIRRLHKIITKNTLKYPDTEGKYRTKGLNVGMGGSEYKTVPGGHVKSAMDELITGFNKFYKNDKLGAIVRFYSGFIAVHPFTDGNGRVSRMILNWLLIQNSLPPINFRDDKHMQHVKFLEMSRSSNGHEPLGQFILNRIKLNVWTNR